MNTAKQMYQELLSIYNKYSTEPFFDEYEFNDVRVGKQNTERHLKIFDIEEKYGIKLKHTVEANRNYYEVGNYRYISYVGDTQTAGGNYISRSDDGRQPKDEWLFIIHFPTGGYIFGDDYPKEIFEEFFNELKSYNPKYSDTTNHYLYWSLDNCVNIFNEFDNILKKYNDKNIENYKARKIKRMEEEIERLKK